MPGLVLDSGGVSFLAARRPASVARLRALQQRGLWPALIPSIVLVECLTGDAVRDAPENRLLKTCEVAERLPIAVSRRAALLRRRARQGGAVDAAVVALAEPGGAVLTSDLPDVAALAAHAEDVVVELV